MTATATETREQRVRPATPEQRAVIRELEDIRDQQLRISNAAFHREHLAHVCSQSTWDNVRKDSYIGNTAEVCSDLAIVLHGLKAQLKFEEQRTKARAGEVYHAGKTTQAVVAALEEGLESGTEERNVVLLAPFGWGKTALLRYLARRFSPIWTAQCDQSWFRSYSAGLFGVARALKIGAQYHTLRELIGDINRTMTRTPGILAYDDANTCGPAFFNMVRDLTNATPSVQLIVAIPQIFDRLQKKSFWEAGQMIRRCIAVVEAKPLTTADVNPFLAGLDLSAKAEAVGQILTAANQFGSTALVCRITRQLAQIGGTLRPDDVAAAVATQQALLRVGQRRAV